MSCDASCDHIHVLFIIQKIKEKEKKRKEKDKSK